jgi:SAM-dependent methyltransferase
MVRNRFFLNPFLSEEGDAAPGDSEFGHFRSDIHELPLPNKALDAVVLHHVLEAAGDPRTAIREVSRTLAPGGRLLIVAFNPWSLWGMRGAYARFFDDSFSGLRFVSSRRLLDWLAVLGFELQHEIKYLAYDLPFAGRGARPNADADTSGASGESTGSREKGVKDKGVWWKLKSLAARHRLPFGGVYVISAVKQAAAIRPDWSAEGVRGRKLAPAAYPKLSARIAHFPARTRPERIEDPG